MSRGLVILDAQEVQPEPRRCCATCRHYLPLPEARQGGRIAGAPASAGGRCTVRKPATEARRGWPNHPDWPLTAPDTSCDRFAHAGGRS